MNYFNKFGLKVLRDLCFIMFLIFLALGVAILIQ